MTTLTDLLAACALDPEDDTLRLALADWLQEREENSVECNKCRKGKSRTAFDEGWEEWTDCRYCSGSAYVSNGYAARAEFIRVQVELARNGCHQLTYRSGFLKPQCCGLHGREHVLLASHPEWRSCPCPECGGAGALLTDVDVGKEDFCTCPTCHGTGDLFKRRSDRPFNNPNASEPRTITYDRGLPLVECTLGELGRIECELGDVLSVASECNDQEHPGRRFVTSPWARAVAERGMVVGFRVRDRGPRRNAALLLHVASHPSRTSFDWTYQHPGDENNLPEWLFREVQKFQPAQFRKVDAFAQFDSPDAAHLALARAAGRAVWEGIGYNGVVPTTGAVV